MGNEWATATKIGARVKRACAGVGDWAPLFFFRFRQRDLLLLLSFRAACYIPRVQPVLDYLQANEGRFIEDPCAYPRFPSVSAQSHHKKDLTACAEWLVARCRSIGLETRLCPTEGNPIVVARTPSRP